jgi:hypothetical protein
MIVNLWLKMLSDTECYIVEAAIEKFLVESKFPPTIADIRERIADITVVKEKTSIEAWNDVKTSIRKFGFYREKDAMEMLSGTTRKVVEAIGFSTLCLSENEMVDRAHFLKVYDNLANRDRTDALMFQNTKDIISRLHSDNSVQRLE